MPYSGQDDPSLPLNVKKLSGKRRRQWIHVFDSERKRGRSDGDAIRIANGVVKGSRSLGRGGSNMGLVDQLMTFFGLNGEGEGEVEVESAFSLREMPDGRLRYYSIASNNYEDRGGLIFPAAGQRKYVEFVERTGKYPELWMWHARGSRLGIADKIFWVDEHIQFTSGLIDEGREATARKLAGMRDLGMSHGYVGRHVELPDGTVEVPEFVQFEQSVLPHRAAANFGTYFGLLGGAREIDMARFTDEQREWFRSVGESDDRINEMEQMTSEMQSFFEHRGIDFRSLELADGDPAPAGSTGAAGSVGAVGSTGTQAQNTGLAAGSGAGDGGSGGDGGTPPPANAAGGLSEETGAAILAEIRSMNAGIRSLVERSEESDDEKFARQYGSRVASLPRGFKASERGADPRAGAREGELIGAGPAGGPGSAEWLDKMFGTHPVLGNGNGRNQ